MVSVCYITLYMGQKVRTTKEGKYGKLCPEEYDILDPFMLLARHKQTREEKGASIIIHCASLNLTQV